ncbi:MAG TPA: tetratricopeptide repeat protein [candidate division Zixibacteria bacterium]|nr:tetratricopeptide repeat protein [candidate division Zixibacteria bacterium]
MLFRINTIILILLISSSVFGIDLKSKGAIMTQQDKADSLLSAADDIFKSNKINDAFDAYSEAFESARKEFNRSVEVEALAQMARMKLKSGYKDEGRIFLSQAQERASETDPMGYSRFLGVKGRFEWLNDSLKDAQKTFSEMYDYCQANALWGRVIDAANMMAIVSETPEEQIKWSKKGIETAEATETEGLLGALWNNLAGTYYDIKDFENALKCYKKSREYHWRFSGEVGKLYADYHIGMTYRLLGQFDEAGKWLRPVLAWAERLDNHSAIGQACEDLGEIEAAKGNKAEALNYLKRARDEYKKAGFDTSWQEIWDNINTRIKQVDG